MRRQGHVDVRYQRVYTHMKLQKVTKLRKLAVEVLVHSVKALLQLLLGQLADGIMCGVVVYIRQKDCLRESGLDVLS